MQTQFQPGDLVANKANPKVAYTFLNMQGDNGNAVVLDGNNERLVLPAVVLIKYEAPKGSTVRDISNMW